MRSPFVDGDKSYIVPDSKGFKIGTTYVIELDDISIQEKKVVWTSQLDSEGVAGKEFDKLTENKKNIVLNAVAPTRYKSEDPAPRYRDVVTISFRGTGDQKDQRLFYENGLQFDFYDFNVKVNKETGKLEEGYLEDYKPKVPRSLIDLIKRLFGVELTPNDQFKITDYFKKGQLFKTKMKQSKQGYPAVDIDTLVLADETNKTTAKELSANARKLQALITLEKLTSKGAIVAAIGKWESTGELPKGEGQKAWQEIRDQY